MIRTPSERGGVLGAMGTMVQRGTIQEKRLYWGHKKHDGSLPVVGVNTSLPKEDGCEVTTETELIRSTPEEKGQQITRVLALLRSRDAASLPIPQGEGDVASTASDRLRHFQYAPRNRKNSSPPSWNRPDSHPWPNQPCTE